MSFNSTYYMTSVLKDLSIRVWGFLRRMEPLRWSSYMDECVDVLYETQESDLDGLLICQAKSYQIIELTIDPTTQRSLEDPGPISRPPDYLQGLLQQLEDVKSNLQAHLQSNSKLRSVLKVAQPIITLSRRRTYVYPLSGDNYQRGSLWWTDVGSKRLSTS